MTRFHGYFRSSAAYRCRIAFNLKGFAPDSVYVHLRKGEQQEENFAAVNPQKLVPALELDTGEVLTQSLAIIEWLDETQPEPALLPKDPVQRARVRAFAQIIACDIHPLHNLRVLQYLRNELGLNQAGVDSWCRNWIGQGLEACEALLARNGRHRFCFGDAPGLADVCLVPQMFSAERFGVDVSGLPMLRSIIGACGELPAFAKAHPSVQSDAE